jgi:ferric-dicitrate binding protein FerR (iron transport regulator)
MAAKDSLSKAGEAARAAQSSRYIQRLVEDEELRSNLLSAYAAARSAYGRMSNGKPATQALFQDRKLQRELTEAANSLRQAGNALREPAKPARRRGGVGRALVALAVGSVLAVALSENLRTKLLDMLFGAEEEFDYTTTTTPETPAPAGVAGS